MGARLGCRRFRVMANFQQTLLSHDDALKVQRFKRCLDSKWRFRDEFQDFKITSTPRCTTHALQ